MGMTIGNQSGDGLKSPLVNVTIAFQDSGQSVAILGQVQAAGGALASITGSPLVAPVVPGSGTAYWIIQVNLTTGASSVKQSTSAMPNADAGNIGVFSQTLPSGANADMVLQGGFATVDT